MGIPGLYKIVGDVATKCSLRQLSADHFKKTGRPFTVAVDEAHWRFHNVDAVMAATIRAGAPGANPIEKNILYRLFELQRLNIRVIMVTDGNDKPASKGKGNMDPESTRILKEVCEALAVEWHQAPGEGEAECAAMQRAGIVDAVWSEDSDAFMFGATVVIRDITGKKNGKNSRDKEHVLLLKMEDVTRTTGFTQMSCFAFALLAGCDYAKGLWNCREVLAKKLALHGELAEMLCDVTTIATPKGRDSWRRRLNDALLEHNGQASVEWLHKTPQYPKLDIIKACVQPSVSSAATLQRLPLEPRSRTTADMATAVDFLSGWFNRNPVPTWPVPFLVPGEVNNRFMIAGRQSPGAASPTEIPIQLKRRNDLETSVVVDPSDLFPGLEAELTSRPHYSSIFARITPDERRKCQHNLQSVNFKILNAVIDTVAGGIPSAATRANKSVSSKSAKPAPPSTGNDPTPAKSGRPRGRPPGTGASTSGVKRKAAKDPQETPTRPSAKLARLEPALPPLIRTAPRASGAVIDLTLSSSPPKVPAVFNDDQENRTRPVKRIFVPDLD